MNNLVKIKDMSSKYGISARTLRYYEDMGLINSTRTDEYAYRLYDEATVKKLEQILILRKLNINIKDIQRIFNSSGSETVLDILSKKVEDIDGEVSLLHELKDIIFTFIHYIKKVDFNNESDVKMLYDRAKEIETQITNVEYEGHPSSTKKLLASADKPNLNTVTDVDLRKMVVTYYDEPETGHTGKYSFTDQGELVIISKGCEESDFIGLQTNECFKLPLKIDVVVKSSGEIWFHYNEGGLALNHSYDSTYYLHVNDIFTGQHKSYPMEKLLLDEYTEISWILDYGETNIYINGEHFHTHVWPSAMPFAEKAKISVPVDVCAGNASTVTVKSLMVTELQITTSGVNRLLDVTEKYNQRLYSESVMIINLPKCKAITSGWQWEDDMFHAKGGFNEWVWDNKHLHKEVFFGTPTFWFNKKVNYHGEQSCYNITVHDHVLESDAAPYDIIEFEGGLYAALHGSGMNPECDTFYPTIMKWLEGTNFEYDSQRLLFAQEIFHNQNTFHSSEITKGVGYNQLLMAVPIKLRVLA